MRGDDTSEDKAKLLMSGKIHSMGILDIVHFFDQFYLPVYRTMYYASYDTTLHFSSRFKSLIGIQKQF